MGMCIYFVVSTYQNALTLRPYGIYQLFQNCCNGVQKSSLCQAATAPGKWHNGRDAGGTPQICTSSTVQSEMRATCKGNGNVSLENPPLDDSSPHM